MFFEKNAQEALEKFVPNQSDVNEVRDMLLPPYRGDIPSLVRGVIKIIKSFYQVLGCAATTTSSE